MSVYNECVTVNILSADINSSLNVDENVSNPHLVKNAVQPSSVWLTQEDKVLICGLIMVCVIVAGFYCIIVYL